MQSRKFNLRYKLQRIRVAAFPFLPIPETWYRRER